MILYFLQLLKSQGFDIPAAFFYTSTRMMLAAATSLIICIFLGPPFIRKLYEMKIGQTIRKEECPLLGELHHKKQDTPTMGGVLILSSLLISLLLWMDLSHSFTWIFLITTIFLGLVGGYDDYLKIKRKSSQGLFAKQKLLLQFALSSLIAAYLLVPSINEKVDRFVSSPTVKEKSEQLTVKEYASRLYIPFVKFPVTTFPFALAFIFISVVITGTSNAVNLTDGLDGLASGCLFIASGCFAVIAFISNNIDFANFLNILYIEGSGEVAIYLSSLSGACLGFLWYNGHPAQVFMGDTGSLTLGGIIGVSAVLLKKELLLGIVGGIFVAEALSVILQVGSFKLRGKKRIFLCAPLHHHFEYKGWSETKVVIRFWIIAILLAIVGLTSLKLQ